MSCTENESGPFVVFFLPAVVGCLTILLARRWACAQVSNTSSTAVSRRRKIIKDPLIKRPLPTIPCKMVAPSSKKSAGVTKKGTVPTCDDDITSGKRMARSRLCPTPITDSKLDSPLHPKHVPFPYIPQDGELLFEAMSLMFTLMATALQYLNLYRTAWWLPHSLNDQTVNYYLIDPHVVAFIITILSRRFVYILSLTVMRQLVPEKKMPLPHVIASFRMFILGVVIGSLAWCTYFIMRTYSIVKIFYLCYPAVIYFLLFGFTPGPFLELNCSETPPLHCCSQDPTQVRAEVEVLRLDFNIRVKKILFNSVLGAYYTSFVPCCFAQPFVFYEVLPAAQQVCLVWGALCGRYAAQLLSASATDPPHRAAHHLGRWAPLPPDPHDEAPMWSGGRVWSLGARARHAGALHVAAAPAVAAEPHDLHHIRFYSVFNDPSTLLCIFLCMQMSLVALQLCLLFSSLAWNNFLAIVLLLFINYYSLFKMLRDYLVAWKVYRAENIIQDKNGSIQMPLN